LPTPGTFTPSRTQRRTQLAFTGRPRRNGGSFAAASVRPRMVSCCRSIALDASHGLVQLGQRTQ
jgi:hypothetical protein